jgi:hypothetical protein
VASEPVRGAIITPVLALVCALLPLPPWIFETFYSRDTYPWLQSGFTTVSNLTSMAVLDLLIGGMAALVLYRAVRLMLVARQRGVLDATWEATRRVARMVSVLVILFFFSWGFNYRRQPLESSFTGGAPAAPTATSLLTGFNDANVLAGRLRATVQAQHLDFDRVAADLREPMAAALKALGRSPLPTPSRAKHSFFVQPFFVRAGVDGMVNPLALESILNEDLLPFERPFVLAHEWAHLAGHADEAEASAVGWFACMQGGAAFAYSASLYLIMQTQAALPADVRRQALGRLSPGVRDDLVAISERLEQEDPNVQRAAARVYDEYLKANRVEDGNGSYGRALQLILASPLSDALRNYR